MYLYLGNSLDCEVQADSVVFKNYEVKTSIVVSIANFKIVSNPDKLDIISTEELITEASGGGDLTENKLKVQLKPNTSFIMCCNYQNQIDNYMEFIVDDKGFVKFKTLAEECFYTSEFQGYIGNSSCTEQEFKTFVNSLTDV